jgi:excisionase family DNA binding protein
MEGKLLSKEEFAFRTNVSMRTVDRYIRAGHIKSFRVGKRVMIQENELPKPNDKEGGADEY